MNSSAVESTVPSGHAKMRVGGGGVGYWVVLDSVITTERIAALGYDWIVLDAQHGELDLAGVTRGILAASSAGTSSFVRVLENSLPAIGGPLDRGAAGVIVPLINTADDARRAVDA